MPAEGADGYYTGLGWTILRESDNMTNQLIKECTYCKSKLTLTELAKEPCLVPIGMSFDGNEFDMAYYYFQHEIPECGTSILVAVNAFEPFISEDVPETKLTLSDECEEHCVNIKDLSECKQECFFAPFRRFLLQMLETKKRNAEEKSGMAV
jgi:hypothetical protein